MHQACVGAIVDSTSLKEGNAKELSHLENVVIQHLQALGTMDYDPSGPFIKSILELKLCQANMFKW